MAAKLLILHRFIWICLLLVSFPRKTSSLECAECISVPLLLNSEIGSYKTNIILHPDDSISEAVERACESIQLDFKTCKQGVIEMLQHDDWVAEYLGLSDNVKANSIVSRHTMFTIMSKIRTFVAPRHVLIFGLDGFDAQLWRSINSNKFGGVTCFANRQLLINPGINADCSFARVAEASKPNPSVSSLHFDINQMAPFVTIPWDVVIYYPSDMCGSEDNTEDMLRVDPIGAATICSNIRPDAVCTRRLMCMQLYLDFSSDLVTDSGYYFVVSSERRDAASNPPSYLLNFDISEKKFLSLQTISPHADDRNANTVFYTSQETGAPTLAGSIGVTTSDFALENNQFVKCISSLVVPIVPSTISSRFLPARNVELRSAVYRGMRLAGYSRIVGILFCCRRRYTDILIPYLRRNLRNNGGIIDQILVFTMGTEDGDDAYPNQVASLPGFMMGNCTTRLFGCSYTSLANFDKKALYLKLDDDILYIAEDAIEHLILEKLNAPAGTIVHGNGINHMHAPFLQSQLPFSRMISSIAGSAVDDFKELKSATCNANIDERDETATFYPNPFQNNWLRSSMIAKHASIDEMGYNERKSYCMSLERTTRAEMYGRDWTHSDTANSHHRMFLDLMDGTLDILVSAVNGNISYPILGKNSYRDSDSCSFNQNWRKLPKRDQYKLREEMMMFKSFDLNACRCSRPQPAFGYCSPGGYFRTSINFVVFDFADIENHMDVLTVHDEIALTVMLQERTGVHQRICGRALYSHAAFTPQRLGGLEEAGILRRYRDLARSYYD